MKTIKVQVDDDCYRRLVDMRRAEGLPSISALFLHKCEELTADKKAAEISRRARISASKLDIGDEFGLRDLFKRSEWDGFEHGVRTRAGKMFYAHVETATSGIIAAYKTASNHQVYRVTSKPAR